MSDVDNLAKGVLDALQGVVYRDDRQVQCLTSRRVSYDGPKGAYLIRATAVEPWDVDVIHDSAQPPVHAWPALSDVGAEAESLPSEKPGEEAGPARQRRMPAGGPAAPPEAAP
jgi:hypothetical protein